ncbi:MAG TPA: GNAT family N-acetyltransferase [Xanthomonadales bacterium]|nr:GNAT family N-acetyltransferase [Xanthomonadales bacterium]
MPYLPNLHTAEEDSEYFVSRIVAGELWVAEVEGSLTGFCAFNSDSVDHVFVHPAHQRRGVGTALLQKAKDAYDRLQLWTFQRNEIALRFYELHGFTVAERTDGKDNEEREPDVRLVWERS